MSNPLAALQAALSAAIRADAAVSAALGGTSLSVYGVPPVNRPKPYGIIAGGSVEDDLAEGIDGATTDLTVDIWSLTDPPGLNQVEALAAAVEGVALSLGDIAGHRLVTAERVLTRILTDPGDGKTAHAVVQVRFWTEPL